MNQADDQRRRLRWAIYGLLIVLSSGAIVGRILTVRDQYDRTPFLSANDRSRWAAIRALGDTGDFAIDSIIREVDPDSGRRPWHTIDRVRHRGWDGREHDYSSKPPLLITLLAGEYWVIKQLTGATLAEQTFYVGRLMLILSNVLPLILFWWLLARLVDDLGETDWGRCFTMAAAVGGTFLSTFAITLNNHLPAAISVFLAVWFALPLWRTRSACPDAGHTPDACASGWRFAAAGFFAAFAAANELPAASFAAVMALALLIKSPGKTIVAFLPAALVVAVAFFATNWIAHGSLRPPYTQRGDGPLLATLDVDLADDLEAGRVPSALREAMEQHQIDLSPRTTVTRPREQPRWVVWDPVGQDRLAIVKEDDRLAVRAWGNWYEYAGSYWTEGRKVGVDLGEPSRLAYAFHVIAGHHGVFSLTPIWLLSIVGGVVWWRRGPASLRWLAAMVMLLTVVCLVFYIGRPLEDRNYGGVSSGFRWMFWLIPLWLICLIPGADAIAERPWLRRLALLLLLVSVISASYASLNPWSHPWLYQYWTYLGWVRP